MQKLLLRLILLYALSYGAHCLKEKGKSPNKQVQPSKPEAKSRHCVQSYFDFSQNTYFFSDIMCPVEHSCISAIYIGTGSYKLPLELSCGVCGHNFKERNQKCARKVWDHNNQLKNSQNILECCCDRNNCNSLNNTQFILDYLTTGVPDTCLQMSYTDELISHLDVVPCEMKAGTHGCFLAFSDSPTQKHLIGMCRKLSPGEECIYNPPTSFCYTDPKDFAMRKQVYENITFFQDLRLNTSSNFTRKVKQEWILNTANSIEFVQWRPFVYSAFYCTASFITIGAAFVIHSLKGSSVAPHPPQMQNESQSDEEEEEEQEGEEEGDEEVKKNVPIRNSNSKT